MDWSGKRALVTGAGGFIGSHLTERLVELGAEVRALVRYNAPGTWGWLDHSPARGDIEVIAGDVSDADSVRHAMQGREYVFHLAALIGIPYSYRAPASYVRTNVEGTLNILQAARVTGPVRVVHTSTSEVYGTAQYVPIDEAHPLQAQSPYAATKIAADKLAESFYLSFGVPAAIVRPFNTFGPRQSARAVIPAIITQCLAGDIVRLGNLAPTRDMNYVANTVAGFVKAAESEAALGRAINLGSGREISIGDLAKLIAALVGKDITIESEAQRLRPEKSEVNRLLADNTQARDLLGWEPAVSLEDGLARTIAWLREHMDRYRPGVYAV
ncbi:MAG: GDP-mannose 4,6-dehydratase [Anaerolineae bacterium]|nr:GDP-mannose 4,6-dehydratase [Anaerolineae bacterium]